MNTATAYTVYAEKTPNIDLTSLAYEAQRAESPKILDYLLSRVPTSKHSMLLKHLVAHIHETTQPTLPVLLKYGATFNQKDIQRLLLKNPHPAAAAALVKQYDANTQYQVMTNVFSTLHETTLKKDTFSLFKAKIERLVEIGIDINERNIHSEYTILKNIVYELDEHSQHYEMYKGSESLGRVKYLTKVKQFLESLGAVI